MHEFMIMAPGGGAQVTAKVVIGKSIRTFAVRYMPAVLLYEQSGGALKAAFERVQRMLSTDGIELKEIGHGEYVLGIDGPLEACEALALVADMLRRMTAVSVYHGMKRFDSDRFIEIGDFKHVLDRGGVMLPVVTGQTDGACITARAMWPTNNVAKIEIRH